MYLGWREFGPSCGEFQTECLGARGDPYAKAKDTRAISEKSGNLSVGERVLHSTSLFPFPLRLPALELSSLTSREKLASKPDLQTDAGQQQPDEGSLASC